VDKVCNFCDFLVKCLDNYFGGINMSSTKDSIKKMLEEKRQGTKQQGSGNKKAAKNLGGNAQTSRAQRSSSSAVNKSV